jgi:class 3 adenylate cyclase
MNGTDRDLEGFDVQSVDGSLAAASTASSAPGWKSTSHYKKHATQDTDISTIAESTAFSGSVGSEATANIWTRLLGNDKVWDGLSADAEGNERSGPKVLALGLWYETKHFVKTVIAHPQILLVSLAVTGLAIGLGMWAITGERDAYVADKKQTAEFVARETAAYFASEFKKAFVPLYSLREAIVHSGYFDDLATQIGRYPNRLKANDVEVPGGLANLRDIEGICDDPDILKKWGDLVSTVNRENDLDGMIIRYRLLPKNTFCLEYKGGQPMMDSGMDTSNSNHPFWRMVAEDLFVNHWKGLHVFGPFMSPKGDELFCTHLAIQNKAVDTTQTIDLSAMLDAGSMDVFGTEVKDAYGYVMNYLNWGEMKKRSNIYEKFADVNMDFRLNRLEEDMDPDMPGPQGEATEHFGLLAESENSHLLNDENSIVVHTESLHGIWVNRVGIANESGWNPEWWASAVATVVCISILLGFLTASAMVKSQLHRNLVKKLLPAKAIKKVQREQTVVERFNFVTVFYADVVGFDTSLARLSPDQVMGVLNDLYFELDALAKKHGVYKVETVGSRYMVVGGAPDKVSATVGAKRVALFALDAMSFIDTQFLTKEGDKLFVRAGISSGPAVAGVVGRTMPRYCFFGGTVDMASKLEKTSKKMRVLCSETTFRLLQDSDMMFDMTRRNAGEGEVSYWINKASPCDKCFGLKKGSFILQPCGHVVCASCNVSNSFAVCPTCRTKIANRTEWTQDTPEEILDALEEQSNTSSSQNQFSLEETAPTIST